MDSSEDLKPTRDVESYHRTKARIAMIPGWIFIIIIALQIAYFIFPKPADGSNETINTWRLYQGYSEISEQAEPVQFIPIAAQLFLLWIWKPPLTPTQAMRNRSKYFEALDKCALFGFED